MHSNCRRTDWDSFETSWDFTNATPLVKATTKYPNMTGHWKHAPCRLL